MTTLTVTAKGQVTLRKDLLRHLGVAPGQKIEARELPGGRIEIRAGRPAGDIEDFIGLLAGKTKKVASIEEVNEAAARGWAEGE
jgi:antitoxin PrlF